MIRRSAYVTGANGSGSGSAPTYTVTTFANLPAGATAGQRCTVTGETGLSGVVCVNVSANVWSLESVTCAETAIPAYGATADTWYSSGGITVTAGDGCWLYDTTYGRSLRWWPAATLGTDGVWVQPAWYAGTGKALLFWHEGTESDAALAAQGYIVLESAGAGTASVSTASNKLTVAATNPGTPAASTAAIYYNDAGGTTLTSTANVGVSQIAQIGSPTGVEARAHFGVIDGAQAYEWGSAIYSSGLTAVGQYFSGATGYTAYTAQTAGTTTTTSESSMDIEHHTGFVTTRFGGASKRTTALSSATARASASKQIYVAIAQANVTGAATASMTTRRGFGMVWT